MRWLRTLNEYATLIGAVATVVYVTLTYTMLRVLRRESMRDQRLRHLTDIKEKVITPINKWLDNVVIAGLKGQTQIVFIREVPKPMLHVGPGGPSTQNVLQLGCDLPIPDAIKSILFLHGKEEHFPDEFAFVQLCAAKLEPLSTDLLHFANGCADKIAGATSLQRNYPAAARSTEFANSDFLTALYVNHLLARNDPVFEKSSPAAGVVELTVASGGIVVARGTTDAVTSWHESAQQLLLERWRESNLGRIALETIDQALRASALLSELQLTYELKGNCRYLGAGSPSRIKVGLRSLRRWLKHTYRGI